MKTSLAEVAPFTTKDGSIIRELMHPRSHDARQQSLAEATVPPGVATVLHRHARTEELYHIVAGSGRMTLGQKEFEVSVGDTVCIPPGTPHRIRNPREAPLVLLCCCAPAYSDEDISSEARSPVALPDARAGGLDAARDAWTLAGADRAPRAVFRAVVGVPQGVGPVRGLVGFGSHASALARPGRWRFASSGEPGVTGRRRRRTRASGSRRARSTPAPR